MAVTHTSRTGKTYYLHVGQKRGGGVQHFFSTKAIGNLAESLPEDFEVYENIDGQVFARRKQPKLILDEELDWILKCLSEKCRGGRSYKAEVLGNILTIHESSNGVHLLGRFGVPRSLSQAEVERFARYQAVLRFVLLDKTPERRLFAPERYCFRGSVEDWISVGKPDSIKNLAAKFLKHLGQDSMYDLF